MRLKFQKWNYGVTASQTSYLINMRRPSREFDEQDTGSKGIILLVVCGVYAICLFIAARLIGYAASRLTKSGEFFTHFTFLIIDRYETWAFVVNMYINP